MALGLMRKNGALGAEWGFYPRAAWTCPLLNLLVLATAPPPTHPHSDRPGQGASRARVGSLP